MAFLILVRHGLTEWNKIGRWQGLTDIHLSDEGRDQARVAAATISDIRIDAVYLSPLKRVTQTYDEISRHLGLKCLVFKDPALNERDYGIYTGKNKWEVQKELGEKEFRKLRRYFDYPVPEGETLKNVYDRVVPFYQRHILADLKEDQNIMVVSSGNTLRALIKYLEDKTDDEIADFELGFADIYVFKVDKQGKIIDREIRVKGLYQGKH